MKFKKIEISAFRIYDKPEDSTFDFSINENEVANFISLYAPNGFGKTSFYDAIEWGITNNIQRFWQNENTNESIDALREETEKQVNLIRRAGSVNATYVKITNDIGTSTIRDLNVHGKKKVDINNIDIIENKPFRQVILSQEWISAFLKEVNGERRYQIFMENPDLLEIDTYYKGVKSLVSICQEKISDLKNKIHEDQKKLIEINEGNLLDTINSSISLLVEKGEKLTPLTLLTTDKDALKFRNDISEKLVSFNKEAKLADLLINITIAKIGKDEIVGINLYFENLIKKKQSEEEIERLTLFIKKFEDLEKSKNELNNSLSLRKKQTKEKELVDQISAYFLDYETIQKSIEEKSNIIKKQKEGIITLRSQLDPINHEDSEIRTKLKTVISTISEIESKITKLPQIKINIETLKIEFEKLEIILESEKLVLNTNEANKKRNENKIEECKKIISEIKNGNYPFLLEGEAQDASLLIKELKVKEANLVSLELSLNELNNTIDQQQSLNSNIEEFIKRGLEIVNESQSSNCPLCDHVYESYNDLVSKYPSDQVHISHDINSI
jgi:DNA repair protein SbcC/Rad50